MGAEELVGRELEHTELVGALGGHRLVTVVGPGGVGKSALARAAATSVADRFAAGVHVVDLTRVTSAAAVPGALAMQLGFGSFEALFGSPGDRPALVIVDNCEHVLDAAAAAIGDLLEASRQPTVLATSRSPLDLPGECVVALAPLRTASEPGEAFGGPAVELFLQRAREAGAAVDDPVAVAELCRRLDGLPLAIEIAAARARLMSVTEIASRLDAGDDVLDRPRFRGPARHRSIAHTVRWSYELLDKPAQTLFRQLGVFAGPFDRAAVAAVGEVAGDELDRMLDELVHAALVVVDTSERETCFRLLDTIRRFALAELAATGERDSTYERYVDHVVDSVQRAVDEATTVWRPELLRRLLDSYDDIAEAVRWCNGHDTTPERALALCGALWPVAQQGRVEDTLELAQRALGRWPAGAGAAAAAATLAIAEQLAGDPERARDVAERYLELVPADSPSAVPLYRAAGHACQALGDRGAAVELLRRGARAARKQGLTAMALELEVGAAQIEGVTGDRAAARAVIAGCAREAERIGASVNLAWASTADAWLAVAEDPAGAVPLIQLALSRCREISYTSGVVANLRALALAHLRLGELPAAVAAAGEMLAQAGRRGSFGHLRALVEVAALIADRRGHSAGGALAATVPTLPITLLAGADPPVVPLPASSSAPLTRREVLAAVQDVLLDQAPAAPVSPEVATLRLEGDVAEITFAGRRVSVRRTKGLVDLRRLLAEPGLEIHCLDLAGAGVEDASTGELIDVTARRDYERRIRELQADLDEAEQRNDRGRAEQLQVELDQLVDHLAAALGRGGARRRAPGTAERARSAVTQRLRAALRQLEEAHPELGRHLRRSVSTGLYCRYEPDPPVTWRIEG